MAITRGLGLAPRGTIRRSGRIPKTRGAIVLILLAIGAAGCGFSGATDPGASSGVDDTVGLTAECKDSLHQYLKYSANNLNTASRMFGAGEDLGGSDLGLGTTSYRFSDQAMKTWISSHQGCVVPEVNEYAAAVKELSDLPADPPKETRITLTRDAVTKGQQLATVAQFADVAFAFDGNTPTWRTDEIPRPSDVIAQTRPDDPDVVRSLVDVVNSSR